MATEPYFVIVAHGRHRVPELITFEENGPPAMLDTKEQALTIAEKCRKREPHVLFSVLELED